MCVTGNPRMVSKQRKKNGAETILEQIMTENFPKVVKEIYKIKSYRKPQRETDYLGASQKNY